MRPSSLKCLAQHLTHPNASVHVYVYISLSRREKFDKGSLDPPGMAVLPSPMLKEQNSGTFYNSMIRHPWKFIAGIIIPESTPGA